MFEGQKVVAVLDDESRMRSALGRLLRTHGVVVDLYETGESFVESAKTHAPDCLLLDLHMPNMNGFDVLAEMAALNLPTKTIVITGHDEASNAERVRELGAVDYLLKPLDESVLIESIERASHHSNGSPPPQS